MKNHFFNILDLLDARPRQDERLDPRALEAVIRDEARRKRVLDAMTEAGLIEWVDYQLTENSTIEITMSGRWYLRTKRAWLAARSRIFDIGIGFALGLIASSWGALFTYCLSKL